MKSRWKKGNCVGFKGTRNTAVITAVVGDSIRLRNMDGTEETIRAVNNSYLIKKRKSACSR